MKRSVAVGGTLAVAHAAFAAYIVALILTRREPDWPMYWLFFMAIDFPVSLLLFVGALIPAGAMRPASPLQDFHNFILPLVVLGFLGTL